LINPNGIAVSSDKPSIDHKIEPAHPANGIHCVHCVLWECGRNSPGRATIYKHCL